jgi:hypothetical protein
MIQIRFVTCNDLISRTIRGGQMGFWCSHVEAAVPEGWLGAHYGGGVLVRPIGYDAGIASREAVLNVFTQFKTQEVAFYDFLRSQLGQPYDMAAINDMALGVIAADAPDASADTGWICSGLIGAALLAAGLIGDLPCGKLTTPRDVFNMCAALHASKTDTKVARLGPL